MLKFSSDISIHFSQLFNFFSCYKQFCLITGWNFSAVLCLNSTILNIKKGLKFEKQFWAFNLGEKAGRKISLVV